jgi:hypothetical protein
VNGRLSKDFERADLRWEMQNMNVDKARSRIQEDLALLYLRLNGFFVTGFIAHSAVQGQALTEIDALAVRMRYSAEPEREVGPDELLDLSSEYTDLIICEAKSRGEQLCFNQALTADPLAAAKVLRWSGLFLEKEIPALATNLTSVLAPGPLPSDAPPAIIGPRGVRVRCLLFSLEQNSRRPNQPWFITGTEVFDYAHRCLSPSGLRSSCSTSYDFGLWGDREPIVRYFKKRRGQPPGEMNHLCKALNIGSADNTTAQITRECVRARN